MAPPLKLALTCSVVLALGLVGFRLQQGSEVVTESLTPETTEAAAPAPAPEIAAPKAETERISVAAPSETPTAPAQTPTVRLTGQVLDPAGAPVAGATVVFGSYGAIQFLYDGKGPDKDLVHTLTDDDGRFAFSTVADGKSLLTAGMPDFAPSATSLIDLAPDETRRDLALTLRAGARIFGEVQRSDGTLAPNRRVRFLLEVDSTDLPDSRMLHYTETDDDGHFAIDHLVPGRWGIVSSPDAEELKVIGGTMPEHMLQSTVTVEDGDETHVRLGAPSVETVEVSGRLTKGGEPCGGMMQWIGECDDPMGSQQIAQLDREGHYQVALPTAGAWYMRVMGKSGHGEYYVDIPEGTEHNLDFELPMGQVRGVIRDAAGEPVEGAYISHMLVKGRGYRHPLRMVDDSHTTKADGVFGFDGMTPGTYRFGVTHKDYGSVASGLIELAEGQVVEGLEFTLGEGQRVFGTIMGTDGLPVKGVAVWVHDAEGRVVSPITRTATNSKGRFATPGLPPGEYSLYAQSGKLFAQALGVTVTPDESPSVEMALEEGATLVVETSAGPRPVRSLVQVTDEAGRLLTGLRTSFDPWTWRRHPFDSRKQHVGPLPAGTYRVRGLGGEYGSAAAEITVAPGETRVLPLALH